MNIVLIEPEIPQNAGNIVRTCAITGSNLYMVKPLGFEVSEKHFRRAGLDYHDFANVKIVDSFEEILEQNKDKQFYFASTKSKKTYSRPFPYKRYYSGLPRRELRGFQGYRRAC